MRDLSRKAYLSLSLLTIAVLIVGSYKLHHYVFAVHGYEFHIDPSLSQQTQQQLISFFDEHEDLKKKKPSKIFEVLREEFPYVHAMNAHYQASGLLALEFSAAAPLVKVNKDHVLTQYGDLVNNVVFTRQAVAQLHSIDVLDGHINDAIKECAAHLSADVFARYAVRWHNEHAIWLHDKRQPQFSLLCDATTIPDERMVCYSNSIKEELAHKGAFAQPGNKRWVADMRFNKQIVVYSDQRGGRHG